jgi:hypothetical protein
VLIGFYFLFGYFLALLESAGEIEANNAVMKSAYKATTDFRAERTIIAQTIQNVHPDCLTTYDNNVTFAQIEANDPNIFPYLYMSVIAMSRKPSSPSTMHRSIFSPLASKN